MTDLAEVREGTPAVGSHRPVSGDGGVTWSCAFWACYRSPWPCRPALIIQRDALQEDIGDLASAIELHYDEHSMHRELEMDGGAPWWYMPEQAWRANRELWMTLGDEYT